MARADGNGWQCNFWSHVWHIYTTWKRKHKNQLFAGKHAIHGVGNPILMHFRKFKYIFVCVEHSVIFFFLHAQSSTVSSSKLRFLKLREWSGLNVSDYQSIISPSREIAEIDPIITWIHVGFVFSMLVWLVTSRLPRGWRYYIILYIYI